MGTNRIALSAGSRTMEYDRAGSLHPSLVD